MEIDSDIRWSQTTDIRFIWRDLLFTVTRRPHVPRCSRWIFIFCFAIGSVTLAMWWKYKRKEWNNKMVCKGICVRHKAMKSLGIGRYSTGQKRCQICETFLKWDGLWCPCCGYRLRTRSRNPKFKSWSGSQRVWQVILFILDQQPLLLLVLRNC